MITIVPADTIYYHVFQMCWRRSAVQNWVLPREVSWPVWGERSVLSSSGHVRRGRGGGGGGDIGGGAHPRTQWLLHYSFTRTRQMTGSTRLAGKGN